GVEDKFYDTSDESTQDDVPGPETDPAAVRRARRYILASGIYGPVSVDGFDGRHLPYAENLANLVVSEDFGGVTTAEAMRVLAPGGVLYVRRGGRWVETVKPRPADTDEWTHFLHDASGNAVGHDERVGPPGRLQWLAGPRHGRCHEYTPTVQAVVSSGGRIFYIVDEGPTWSVAKPARWRLVARDAYNGILLWQRTADTWFPHIYNWAALPRQFQRKVVAVGGRVYAAMGFFAPLAALDAATGKTIRLYEQTRGTDEVILHKGILLLAVRPPSPQRTAELDKWLQLQSRRGSPLYDRDTAQPLLDEFKRVEFRVPRSVMAIEASTGKLLWKRSGAATAGLRTLSLSALGERVFYQKNGRVFCVDLKTGRELWNSPGGPLRLVCAGGVICADGRKVMALSPATGRVLWNRPATLCQVRDVFVINGSVWVGGFKPYEGPRKDKRTPPWGPYCLRQRDLATGKVLRRIDEKNPGHHHRCWQNKATDRYILGGRRGVEFIDLASGQVLWNSWVRGVCRYGVMPCNGLLYAPPHACGCYITAKLTGFYALAARKGSPETPRHGEPDRIERGPAYGTQAGAKRRPAQAGSPAGAAETPSAAHAGGSRGPVGKTEAPAAGDWPTYRHDGQRSGCASCAVPASLARKWSVRPGAAVGRPGAKLSSLTVAGGKVFVAAPDEHTLWALDEATGRTAWQFTAGGRIDSPPTAWRSGSGQGTWRVVFGCRDGRVYSLRASDGAMAWRRLAAPADRRVIAYGQVESAWPVHGSVLVDGGAAYVTAGRSSYLDGGIRLLKLSAATGEVLSKGCIYSPDPNTGRQPAQFGPASMPGALWDILSCDEGCVYMRQMVFDKLFRLKPAGSSHLLTLTGFLDATWPHRSYWIFGTHCSLSIGCSHRERHLIYGRVMVFDDKAIYSYGRTDVHWSNQLQDGPYHLFAVDRGHGSRRWSRPVGIRVRAMVLAGGVLFAAGSVADAAGSSGGAAGWDALAKDAPAAEAARQNAQAQQGGAMLLAISAADGRELARCRLESPPVLDGMAAAAGRLFLSCLDGTVVCMEGKAKR
ncbi:MAG: PQQ-binding-like beta-propeller repeat protein, partial [Planctomycetes bacterium]|nr:PQQ-binding-like beta-propeller repeat protein [Planctomycetota bacterium]